MSASPKKKYTAEEYAALECVAEYKSEFYRGEIFPMRGFPFRHNVIKTNVVCEIGNRIRSQRLQTLSSTMRIKVEATGLQTYPDVLLLGPDSKFVDETRRCLLNPLAIIVIRTQNAASRESHYTRIPSVGEIVVVESDEPVCEHYFRTAGGGTWIRQDIEGLNSSLTFATVNACIPLRGIYAGVEFPEPPLR